MWAIKITDTFDRWFTSLNDTDRASMLATLLVSRKKESDLPRPCAGTIRGSRYSNMGELHAQSRGDPIWASFTPDPARTSIVLYAGNKVGSEKRFYHEVLAVVDREFIN